MAANCVTASCLEEVVAGRVGDDVGVVDDGVGDGVEVRSVVRPEVEELLGELGRNEDVAGADDTVSVDVGTLDKFEDDEGAEVDVAGTMVVFDAVDDWPSDTVLLRLH